MMSLEPVLTLAFGMPGGWEWMIILLVALLLFGSRLPQVARSMGDALREFKKGVHDASQESKGVSDDLRQTADDVRKFDSAKPPSGDSERVAHGSESQKAD